MDSKSMVTLTELAYSKMILHCAKYSHCAVNGVFLAKPTKPSDRIVFVDAVPLFHVCLNVAPMYEIAMSQIDAMAQREGLVIAGYYSAEENYLNNESLNDVGLRIASKIAEYSQPAFWLIVENEKFPSIFDGHKNGEIPVQVVQCIDGKWKKIDKRSGITISKEAIAKSETLLAERRDDIFDFDNHLDNLKMDWKNLQFNRLFEEVTVNC